MCTSGLEKSSVLPVLDRFLKLKTNLFLDKKSVHETLYFLNFAIYRLSKLFTPNNLLLFGLILHNRDCK